VWLTHSGARSLRSSLSSDRLDQHTTSACPARPPPRGRRSVTASPAPQAAAAAEAAEARELVEEVRAVVAENYLDARGGGWDAAAWDGACQRVLAGPLRDRAAAHRRAPVRPWRPRVSGAPSRGAFRSPGGVGCQAAASSNRARIACSGPRRGDCAEARGLTAGADGRAPRAAPSASCSRRTWTPSRASSRQTSSWPCASTT